MSCINNVSVSLSSYKLHWMETNTAFTAQTSFGLAHICKQTKLVTFYSPTGTVERTYPKMDIKKVKQKVEDLHQVQIDKVKNLWIKINISENKTCLSDKSS